MPYALREALSAFRRSPLLAFLSVIAIAFSLFVIGLFGLTTWNIGRAIDKVEEKVEIVAYLDDATTPAQLELAQQRGARAPRGAGAALREQDRGAGERHGRHAGVPRRLRRPGQQPAARLARGADEAGLAHPAGGARVAERLKAYPFVEDVRYGREWLERDLPHPPAGGGAATLIGVAFALVAAIIIATAVRIAVFARREEISIMRLVGATDGFMQRPFLLEGLMTGVMGGLLAAFLTWGAYRVLSATMFKIEFLPGEWIVLVVIVGTLFGFLSSMVAVRRHLEEV